MKRILVFFLLFSGLCSYAQNTIYRGRYSWKYEFLHNGTYLWSPEEFSRGSVMFDGHIYDNVNLNIDACRQELMVIQDGTIQPISPDRDALAWFTRGGVCFVNLRYAGFGSVPEGFYEVLTDGSSTVFHQVCKYLYSDIGDFNGIKGIGYDDPDYRYDVLTYFRIQHRYYLLKDGELAPLKPRKARKLHLRGLDASGLGELPESFSSPRMVPSPASEKLPEAIEKTGRTLPAGYFESEERTADRSAMLAHLDQDNIIASYRNKTYEIGIPGDAEGKATVSGFVRDVTTDEALSGVFVQDGSGKNWCYTDDKGFYSLQLERGEGLIKFSEYTKEDMDIRVIVLGSGGLDIVMKEKVTELRSAYVSAETMAEHRRTKIGVEKINVSTLTHIPSAFGEGDVLKAVLTLPGVKTVGEASSGFNVRGGSADQNLILFNESTIYNPSHMFGIFSAFNTDVIDNVELYKSSIPVEYGGRISSVLDIKGKEGNPDRIKGSLGIGLLTSHAQIEGPLVKGKTTFVLGARTTYSDWILRRLPRTSGYSGGTASFSDVNLGVTHKVDERNILQAFGYWSRDSFAFSGDTTFRYSNLNAALRWKHKYGERGLMTASLGYDQYGNTIDDKVNAAGAFSLSTTVRQAFARLNFKQPLESHALSFGGSLTGYALSPGDMRPMTDTSLVLARSLALKKALEGAVYIGDNWQIDDRFSVDGGLRLSGFYGGSPAKAYLGPEFRLSGKWSPQSNISVKAGFNSMNQYIHLISNTSSISPMDTWKLCDGNIKPQTGWQSAAGVYWTVWGGLLDLSLEAYYKKMNNYLDYKSGAVLSMNENLAEDLVPTRGRAYGAELMARKTSGRLTGWLSYSYSRTLLQEMTDRGVETINRGEWYPAAHDKPHDVKFVGNYKFTHRYSFSLNVDYSTGRPVTIPVGKYYYDGILRLAYSDRNGYRIPDYFRMDVAFNIEPGHYLKAFTHASCTLGCYNVTGRKNAYSVYYTTNAGRAINGYMISVFATQIPYVSINLKF